MAQLSSDERRIRLRLKNDFPYFARKCLRIRSESGDVVPLVLNEAQIALHEEIERQWQERGFVRLVVPKARQLGTSTLITGYFLWRVIHHFGWLAFILTHEAKATSNLFGMVERYYDNLPKLIAPTVGKDNANELRFPKMDSGYVVGTAGARSVGRSFTFQLFHGSEVAFWPNAQDHFDGAGNAVPSMGSMLILESSANGVGGPFWATTMAAIRGVGTWRCSFLSWKLKQSNRRVPPNDWKPSAAWRGYQQQHEVDIKQLYWAYTKNADRCAQTGEDPESGPSWRFLQEHPGNVMEAFQSGGEGSFISNQRVVEARRCLTEPYGPIIIGVDPARGGGDRTGVISRQGRVLGKIICERWDMNDLNAIASRLAMVIKQFQPKAMPIDVTGVGAGVYDILRANGYDKIVHAVNFGAQAFEPDRYANRRAEMWDHMREWIDDKAVPVSIPDDDILHSELTAPRWDEGTKFVGTRLLLESKDHIKERLGLSPDLGDAAALTFSVPHALASQLGPAQQVHVKREYNPLTHRR